MNPMDYMYPALILFVFITVVLGVFRAQRRELARLRENFGKIPEGNGPDMESVRGYFDAVRDGNAPEIDDITWNDLEMDEVYRRVNACRTSVGEAYLYAMLRRPLFDTAKLVERENAIAWFEREKDMRFLVQRTLMSLGRQNANGLAGLMWETRSASGFRFARLFRVLSVLPVLSALLFFISTPLAVGAMLGFATINCLIYIYQKARMDAKFITLRSLTVFLGCAKILCGKKYAALPQAKAIRKNFAPFSTVAGKLKSTFFTQRMGGELQPVMDLFKMIVLYDVVRYDRALETVEMNKAEFRALFEAVGELDACIGILSFRLSLPKYCLPEFCEKNEVRFTEIYHPLLSDPVTNSGVIARGSIVTGSNASGKSTFIKTLAINGIFAETIHTCCGSGFKTRLSLVLTSMALRDSIRNGESYFVAEIKSVRRILEALTRFPCVLYMDEILRGTNTPERIAASVAVLRHIAKSKTVCVIASHDIELTELMKNEYDCYSFSERVTDTGVTFDYKLQNGAAKTRNAIKLLGLMGVDEKIVAEAERLVESGVGNGEA